MVGIKKFNCILEFADRVYKKRLAELKIQY
jgi:hypothetical protein